MKLLLLALCGCLFGMAVYASPLSHQTTHQRMLGTKQCTWGPSFWCSNITNAKSCNAVTHCIQTVWEKHAVPEDNDSICKICLDMVQQARDQLESNETQADLKAVFEGSCNLIPLKPVRNECIKLADDFVPELVEALSSQMNPQAVCSVAGLCNNAAIDKMLADMPQTIDKTDSETNTAKPNHNNNVFTCDRCNSIGTIISQKFHNLNRDEFLENLLETCGRMSSFSDACANIVLIYFGDIYTELSNNLNSDNICHMSGVCTEKYHSHPELVEIRPMSNVGVVPVKDDDIPCELCQQLVHHLRDLLIANTTAEEFKTVLEGLCKQTGKAKDECVSIVDQYYDNIYNTLVKDLNGYEACALIQICPRNSKGNAPIMPMVPITTAQRINVKITEKPKKIVLGANEPKLSVEQIQNAQLPIDTLMQAQNPNLLVDGGQWCTICEYFLHFLQEELASPATEEKIKRAVTHTCEKLPNVVRGECHNFVDIYGDAVVALLIQGMDPREVCPKLYLCPQKKNDVEVFAPKTIKVETSPEMHVTINTKNSGTDKCPLCLLAVQATKDIIQSDKSKTKIINTLDTLCRHLPNKLQDECTDFVDTYTAELVQMLSNDFTPQQICANLKLCAGFAARPIHEIDNGDILTNEIPDNTVNGQLVTEKDDEYASTPDCLLCEEVVKEVEKKIIHKKSKQEIKDALEHACDRLKKLKNKCNAYIDKHGDQIVDLLLKELTPKQVCRELQFCIMKDQMDDLQLDEAVQINVVAIPSIQRPEEPQYTIPDKSLTIAKKPDSIADKQSCVLCEFVMVQLEKELQDKKTQEEIENAIKNICSYMPKSINKQCSQFVDQYGVLVIQLIATSPPKEICGKLSLCSEPPPRIENKSEVIQCAVCHASVQSLATIVENRKTPLIVSQVVDETCNQLPAKHYENCSNLMEIYGQSLVNLITRNELHTACSQIGKCFQDEYESFVQIEGKK